MYNEKESLEVVKIKSAAKVIVAGIAKPQPFFDYLKADNDTVMEFPDHHHFSESEILDINHKAQGKIIITTEKDFVRLQAAHFAVPLYYLPIKSQLLTAQETFDQIILHYVGTSTGDR